MSKDMVLGLFAGVALSLAALFVHMKVSDISVCMMFDEYISEESDMCTQDPGKKVEKGLEELKQLLEEVGVAVEDYSDLLQKLKTKLGTQTGIIQSVSTRLDDAVAKLNGSVGDSDEITHTVLEVISEYCQSAVTERAVQFCHASDG